MRNVNIKQATLRLHLGSEHQAILALWFLPLLSCACPWECSWNVYQIDLFFLSSRCSFHSYPRALLPIPAALCSWQMTKSIREDEFVPEANVLWDKKTLWGCDVVWVTQGWMKRCQVLCVKFCLCWMVMEYWCGELWCRVLCVGMFKQILLPPMGQWQVVSKCLPVFQ